MNSLQLLNSVGFVAYLKGVSTKCFQSNAMFYLVEFLIVTFCGLFPYLIVVCILRFLLFLVFHCTLE